MKRLNHKNSALYQDIDYRFVWQSTNANNPTLDAFNSMKESYLAELEKQYSVNHIDKSLSNSLTQLTNGADLYEAAESEFYQSQKSVDLLESSSSKLSKDSQPKLGKRLKYKRERRKTLRALRKDRRNKRKNLKTQEKDFNKSYEQERQGDSNNIFKVRQNGFVGNMESLANDIADLEKRYDKLSSKISVKKSAKNEFREMQRKILEESKKDIGNRLENDKPYDGVNKMLQYLDISSAINPEQQRINAEYAAIGATICQLKETYNNPQYQKILLVAQAKNLPIKSKIAFYKTAGEAIKNKVDQKQEKAEETKKIDASKEDIKKESGYQETLTLKNTTITTIESNIETIDKDLKALRASRYMTDDVQKQIQEKETNKAKEVANLAGKKEALSIQANELLGSYVITAEKSEVTIITQANALDPIIKDQINTVQNTLNAGANSNAEQQLKDLESLLQTLAQKDKINDIAAAKSLFSGASNSAAINTALDNYKTAFDNKEEADRNLVALKSLYTENEIPFNNALDYSSAIEQEKQRMVSEEKKLQTITNANKEKAKLKAEITGRKEAEALHTDIENDEVKEFKEGKTGVTTGYESFSNSKEKLVTINGDINYLLEQIKELQIIVKNQAAFDGTPSPETNELEATKNKLKTKQKERESLLKDLAEHKQQMIKDRNEVLTELRQEIREQKNKREAARKLGNPAGVTAMEAAQTEIDRLNVRLKESARMINTEINTITDIGYLLASNESQYNSYLRKVTTSGDSFVSFADYLRPSRATSRSESLSGTGSRNRRTVSKSATLKNYKRALKDVPRYKAEYTAEEVKNLDTKALLNSITEPSMRNQVANLVNLGLVQIVSFGPRIPKANGTLVRPKFNEFVIKVQPQDQKTGEVKSDIYYTIKPDGRVIWKPSVKLSDGTVRSISPKEGESYNFKEKYNSPDDFIIKTLSTLDDHMKYHDHITDITNELAEINDDFVYDFSTADNQEGMYLEAKVYNPNEADTFIVKFRLDEKGRWRIDKDEFKNLEPSEQDVLEGIGIRSGRKMSRSYFMNKIKTIAKQDEENYENLGTVSKIFRNVGQTVQKGWNWFKGIFGY